MFYVCCEGMKTSHNKNKNGGDGGIISEKVYIKDDADGWVVGVVVDFSKTEARCRLVNGEERIVKLKEYKNSEMHRVNENDSDDLINMDYVHEPGVLFNLIRRCEKGKPYTRAGDILLSINPFHWSDHLYSEYSRKFYAQKLVWQSSGDDPRTGLEPHIYEVSSLAYLGLAFQEQNQSILITGESGAGKTEAAKLIMHHIATIQAGPAGICDRNFTPSDKTSKSLFSDIVERILNTNPLLEAFGNAATSQNDNSSRFGKYTQLQFKKGDATLISYNVRSNSICTLVGSVCDVYLLEASRVCMHACDERNYHIFYQLLSADDELKSLVWPDLVGRTATDFKYVGTPITEVIDGIHDAMKFQETWSTFGRLAVHESDTISLMRAVCLVMQLGNLEFIVDPFCEEKALVKADDDDLTFVSDLLGIRKGNLLIAFTERSMATRGEVFKVPLSVPNACEARDSFAKEIYIRSFSWLVDAMNTKTSAEMGRIDSIADIDLGVIGILDIFGFESFKINRFEQLCINYANEKLQQKAINDIFVSVRDEYEFEGIPLDLVDVTSNQQVLDFIEGRAGLIALLNEESFRPKGNCKAFTSKVFEKYRSLPQIVKPPVGVTNKFGIAHFAGTVMYTTDNFVKGNQDTLPHDLKDCMAKSTNPVVSGSPLKKQNIPCNNSGPSSLTVVAETNYKKNSSTGSSTCLPWERSRALSWTEETTNILAPVSNNSRERNIPHKSIPLVSRKMSEPLNFLKSTPEKQFMPYKRMESDIVATTVGTKYRQQLSQLMQKLEGTHSRYVRCIKPNRTKSPKICCNDMLINQIRSAGIVPTAILSKAMFATSITNKIITVKYRIMWNKTAYPSKVKRVDKIETRLRLEAEAILSSIYYLSSEMPPYSCKTTYPFFIGKTKTFFRRGVLEWFETKRLHVINKCATVIQSYVRKLIVKNYYVQMKSAATILTVWLKSEFLLHAKQKSASKRIQKLVRMFLFRMRYRKGLQLIQIQNKMARTIQAYLRCYMKRPKFIAGKIQKLSASKKIYEFLKMCIIVKNFRKTLKCYGYEAFVHIRKIQYSKETL